MNFCLGANPYCRENADTKTAHPRERAWRFIAHVWCGQLDELEQWPKYRLVPSRRLPLPTRYWFKRGREHRLNIKQYLFISAPPGVAGVGSWMRSWSGLTSSLFSRNISSR